MSDHKSDSYNVDLDDDDFGNAPSNFPSLDQVNIASNKNAYFILKCNSKNSLAISMEKNYCIIENKFKDLIKSSYRVRFY